LGKEINKKKGEGRKAKEIIKMAYRIMPFMK
jgi:hypothetical protein